MDQYWHKPEVLDNMFRHMGIKKKLDVARVNKAMQELIYSWLGRKQKKILLMLEIEWVCKKDMRYDPRCMLLINQNHFDALSRFMELLLNLKILVVTDVRLLYTTLAGGSKDTRFSRQD